MEILVKTLLCRIKDEFGGAFPEVPGGEVPFVAVRYFEGDVKTIGQTESCEGVYDLETRFSAITYKVMFWYSEAKRQEGRRSRILRQEKYKEPQVIYAKDDDNVFLLDDKENKIPTGEMTEGEYYFTELFEVDMNHPEIEQVQDSDMSIEDKRMQMIELDVIRRNA